MGSLRRSRPPRWGGSTGLPTRRPTACSFSHSARGGLRRNEVAALHTSQLVLEPEEDAGGPYIAFDDRKNAAGTVALLYGVEAIRDRLADLADEWNDHTTGYLSPSTHSATGHIDGGTVYRRFGALAERANVRLPNGERPTPHNARKFWYTAYASTVDWSLQPHKRSV